MFAIAKTSSPVNANKTVSVPGTLFYYSDPIPTLHARESLPPSAILSEDIRLHTESGHLPIFTFISASAENTAPIVLQGFLKPQAGELPGEPFVLLVDANEIPISFKDFEEENKKLLQCNKKYLLPVISTSTDDGTKVQYQTISSFQKTYRYEKFILSWIGGLTQLLKVVTEEMVTLLQKPHSELVELLSKQEEQPDEVTPADKKIGVFWIWWSLSKPANVKDWFNSVLDAHHISNEELQLFHREHHPCRAGFYRIWISEQSAPSDEPDPTVDVYWFTDHERVQYRVSVLLGKDDSNVPFGPDSSDRAKLQLQNKMAVSGDKETLWSMEDKLGLVTAFIVPDNGCDPCPLSRSLGISKEEIEPLMDARFGPGTDLQPSLQKAFSIDAAISAKSMWKR